MAELLGTGGAREYHAHDQGAEAAGKAHPLEKGVARKQCHDDAEERAQLAVAKLVPAARGQGEQWDDEDEEESGQTRRFAAEDAHESNGEDVLHNQHADADIAVERLLVAAVLEDLDYHDGARKAQDQSDVDGDREGRGAESAERAKCGDKSRANKRHDQDVGAGGQPHGFIRQRTQIQAQANGEEHEGDADVGEEIEGLDVRHAVGVEDKPRGQKPDQWWETDCPCDKPAAKHHSKVGQQQFHAE